MAKVIIEKLNEKEIEKRGIYKWPVWTKEVSSFSWFYNGDEQCLILEGAFTVHTDEGDYDIQAGDFVTFKDGLQCNWTVTKAVRKHYRFS